LSETAPLRELLTGYDASAPLARASTIPAAWYTDTRLFDLEQAAVFAASWQPVGRDEQLSQPGAYVTAVVAREPVLVVRGNDRRLRGFFNVCRHHAAAVASAPCGSAATLRCPYHGWSYALDGALVGTPEFDGVQGFDRAGQGLLPLACGALAGLVFVRVADHGPELQTLARWLEPFELGGLRFFERRVYELGCNWKVFVDNYLDGGYHVPHLHRGLHAVLDYSQYVVENGERSCLQSSPLKPGGDPSLDAVRAGARARYLWIYPNFMINAYQGVVDTNLVVPLGVDRTRVVFDFYFGDLPEDAKRRSVEVADAIQLEDVGICEAVQRGLGSRAYRAGRLSARREAGEHLFHRLLAADLRGGL
jgi:choline monooxygenase